MKTRLTIPILLLSTITPLLAASTDQAIRHVIVCKEQGRFCGWPANNGIWQWQNEILVGFHQADYVKKDCSHSVGGNSKSLLARSYDGGETWTIEDPENFIGDGGKPVPSPGNINFAHPDFAMRCAGSVFFISYDRGKTWAGPYSFGDFGIEQALTSRTDYIVNSEHHCLLFLSAREPKVQAAEKDRAFCVRTTDGGKTFTFLSWMTDDPVHIRSVMPSTVRCSDSHLVSAMRRRFDIPLSGSSRLNYCWIDVYESTDNGASWRFLSKVADTGHSNGNPPSLVRFPDGRLCVTYAWRGICEPRRWRHQSQGIRARISPDNGKTWGTEIILRSDARTWDIGYTRSVVRPDGNIVTIYYYTTDLNPPQHIAATIWNPDLATRRRNTCVISADLTPKVRNNSLCPTRVLQVVLGCPSSL